MFLAIRELLLNAAKHAEASHVTINVSRSGEQICAAVVDDGRGFEPATSNRGIEKGHIGLATVRERIETAGGTLQIISALGEGTRARLTLPIPPLSDPPTGAQSLGEPARLASVG